MRLLPVTLLVSSLALAACGQSNPPPAPSVSTAPAPVTAAKASTAPAASTAPHAATAPTAASATGSVSAATSAAPAAATAEGPEVAGGVSLAEGSVTDTAGDGSQRQLKDGDEVYPGDSLVLGDNSYLDIDFTDGGRVLLRPDTTFQVQQYHYEPEAHPGADGSPPIEIAPAKPENAFFSLVKGGLRAIDGIIGHTEPQNYGVQTPVATIGVRGTAFDVRYCGDDCQDEADATGAPQNGLYTSVSDGSVGIKNDSGETVTQAGHSGFVKSRREKVQVLNAPPKALRHMALPEKFKARDEKNRTQVKARQQQRRTRIIQRRQQERLHPPAAAGKAKALERGKTEQTPAERREQRQEERKALTPAERRQQMREQRQEKREQQQGRQVRGAVTQVRPGEAKPQTPAERRVQRRQQQNPAAQSPAERKQQGREERQAGHKQENNGATQTAQKPAPQAKPVKQEEKQPSADKARCKDKKYREKNKDKCGG